MESLNLNNLVNSLPTSNLANAEKDVADKFRAAALSITTLYKTSRRTSKRAYNAGYAAACQDMLLMIQQGVSAGESSDPNGGGMTIGRIMDYIEARLEAIKSREEEEDEDEEKDRERERERERALAGGPTKAPLAPMTPLSPSTLTSASVLGRPASTPPSPPSTYRPLQAPQSLLRSSKSRLFAVSNANPKESVVSPAVAPFSATLLSSTDDTSVAIIPPSSELPFPSMTPPASSETTGTKRRYAVMAADSTVPSIPSPSAPTPRRRIRSSRAGLTIAPRENQDQSQLQSSSDAMDVEEDGRERKRITRR
ncbi:hypothetical protein PHLGIDRAFT_24355 [Phlebiopsis gigantea 11061_1 CR5-6]|uniref:Uncharacterized protein n=1 Tax=Phlebiopsis gigantea (strain 11061_1 CR5-6) TaxID=745531 RepID=A0A0C3RY12_PHLG1|nr:hypothetical protein PHLGIDRAFT_24355 [Phlebiopsis gigantea 11061_1 CR5-6]